MLIVVAVDCVYKYNTASCRSSPSQTEDARLSFAFFFALLDWGSFSRSTDSFVFYADHRHLFIFCSLVT